MRNEIEQAQLKINVFLQMIKESWTWARLTEEEKNIFENQLSRPIIFDTIKLCKKNTLSILNALYDTFLSALGYKDWHWRE